ncbi:hypothetical protein AAG570_000862, partial [Ranatra chinensis]
HLDDGTLLCIVCESIVRSGAVWPVHLNSVRHKEKVAERKKMAATATTVLPPQSQPAPPESSLMQPPAKPPLKRPSTSSQLAQSDDSEPKPTPKKLKGILKNAPPLPPGFFDSTPSPVQVKNEEIPEEGLKAEEPGQNCQTRQNQTREADLPEGFFDDPVLDAKARNVEYKDPIQEEWDRFQKEIKEENSVSAQIIQDDTEVATVERQIIEVDEQLRNWSRYDRITYLCVTYYHVLIGYMFFPSTFHFNVLTDACISL